MRDPIILGPYEVALRPSSDCLCLGVEADELASSYWQRSSFDGPESRQLALADYWDVMHRCFLKGPLYIIYVSIYYIHIIYIYIFKLHICI